MKILFHAPTLNFRGVTNSIADYAHYNQTILGNESAILFNRAYEQTEAKENDIDSKDKVIHELSQRFKVYSYANDYELEKVCENFDAVYAQKAGLVDDTVVSSSKNLIHSVFQHYDPHGDRYAYISEWLASRVAEKRSLPATPPWVPLPVELPTVPDAVRWEMRKQLGIPRDAFVFGRHGGEYTFDIKFVLDAVERIAKKNPKIYFLFANTFEIPKAPNIIYIKPFFGNYAKSSFIQTCDAMIHGRFIGESFGLSVCEFLYHNKPVLAWEGGNDQHHAKLLKDHGLLYNHDNIDLKVEEVRNLPFKEYSKIVEPFNAMNSMIKFHDVFLT